MRVFGSQPQLALAPTSPANFLEWKEENQVFERIGAYVGQGFNLLGGDKPERVIGVRISADLLQLLGVQPALGRLFAEEEDQEGRGKVVILSHEFWRTRFGGEANMLQRTITLNDQPYTVVGVMPAGFAFPGTRTQVWVPIDFNALSGKRDIIHRRHRAFEARCFDRAGQREHERGRAKPGRALSKNEHRRRRQSNLVAGADRG